MTSGFFGQPDDLPRRERTEPGGAVGQLPPDAPGARTEPHDAVLSPVRTAMADLRLRVPGVRGSVLAGVDGMLVTYDLGPQTEPHDLAALAATTFGLGRQVSLVLGQSPFRDATMRNEGGYFTVYAVDGSSLLAVLGSDGLNVARLHLEARPTCQHLATLLA
ncbi:roadblock/LC7 domain-containing protein [Dactylosporangium aurantiacum]|uniref:Roadblock/LC7 domain-containing protein n=1 Tax=Dactylosporangium aurantiacum TaxID=35754 RepID=A0A9Q9IJ88_9ACTN|nr:roadblock/LC7 domain-containing protein [Dactylosporangium aurantiacum]MDG6105534.1 roadblock/LC7 domain-containing protein [Dactylosporangium aurantiacum]UWZ57122.1 roadblock/LC7 domain-containing protein [Dactylosporangium aurantiacum]